MIRPFTLVCMLMAGGAGLYLYQSKHRAQMLDREIAKTIEQTRQTRERIGMLKAEWALLNEPDRLSELAKAHLGLRPLDPKQFVALADLAGRLPAPVAPNAPKPPTDVEPEEAPAPAVAQAAPEPTVTPAPAPAAKPVPPRPASVAVAAAAPASATDSKPAPENKPAKPVADAKPPARPRPNLPVQVAVGPRTVVPVTPVASNPAIAPGTVGEAVWRAMHANAAYTAPAPAPTTQAYVQPIYAAPVAATPAYSGSLLGSSRGSLPPPVPFSGR
ncbi:MAG: hypothetical protein JOZ05_16705 [Acetobacteraceae bacterium]|nr:hypothetical protein [Acetobacteraceae bacterium]